MGWFHVVESGAVEVGKLSLMFGPRLLALVSPELATAVQALIGVVKAEKASTPDAPLTGPDKKAMAIAQTLSAPAVGASSAEGKIELVGDLVEAVHGVLVALGKLFPPKV